MAKEQIGIMEIIKRCHKIKNALPCIEFDYSLNPFVGYWYAEEQLYVMCDEMLGAYYFITARSPLEAMRIVEQRYICAVIGTQFAHLWKYLTTANCHQKRKCVPDGGIQK